MLHDARVTESPTGFCTEASSESVLEYCQTFLADQDGAVIVIRVFMDESGTHDHSPVVTVGAYAADPKQWAAWTTKWNIAKRPIKVFHAADCANSEGEFKGWDDDRRNPLVIRLLTILREARFLGIMIGINMVEFEKAMEGHDNLRVLFPSAYGACFHWVVQTLLTAQHDSGNREMLAFIHEVNAFKGEALEAFGYIQKHGNPSGVNMSLTFGTKEKFVPLQAADILAYEGNKRLRDPSRPPRRSWTALDDPEKPLLLAAHYGKNNMPKLINSLEMIRQGRMAELDLGSGWNRAMAHPAWAKGA